MYVYDGENAKRPIKKQITSNASTPEQNMFTVGNNGDFSTLNAAFNYLNQFGNINKEVEIRMLDGYYIEENLEFKGNNFRNVILTSEGDENVVSREFLLSLPDGIPFIDGSETIFPLFAARLRMDESGTPESGNNNIGNRRDLFSISNSSKLSFASSNHPLLSGKRAGIENAMGRGILLFNNSSVSMDFESYVRNSGNKHGEEFTFSGGALSWLNNITVLLQSVVLLSGCESKNSNNNNIEISGGSSAYIQQSDLSGAINNSALVRGSSKLMISFSELRKDGVSESSNDIKISEASILQSKSTDGGSNLTPNTLVGDGLYIKD